jgi:diketogulonate reductase-like aldo/keto reductase
LEHQLQEVFSMSLTRRQFLRYLAGMGSTLLLGRSFPAVAGSPAHSRIIPASGERIPAIGLGSWLTFGIDVDDTQAMAEREAILREFLARGGGLLDSSPMYGTAQEVIGQCLQRIGHRQGLFAATKVWVSGLRQGILQMERSRLLWNIPRFDLMQVHNLLDWETHLPVLQEMKRKGQIRYLGVTTSHGRRHDELARIMRSQDIDFVQFTYNMLDREAEQQLLPLAADKGIAVIINRPFQRGGLFDYVGARPLPGWASELDCESWAQVFLKFVISHPAVTCAIPATSRLDHLKENMAAAHGPLPDAALRQRMLADFTR